MKLEKIIFERHFYTKKYAIEFELQKWSNKEKPNFTYDNRIWNDIPPQRNIKFRFNFSQYSIFLRISIVIPKYELEKLGYNEEFNTFRSIK